MSCKKTCAPIVLVTAAMSVAMTAVPRVGVAAPTYVIQTVSPTTALFIGANNAQYSTGVAVDPGGDVAGTSYINPTIGSNSVSNSGVAAFYHAAGAGAPVLIDLASVSGANSKYTSTGLVAGGTDHGTVSTFNLSGGGVAVGTNSIYTAGTASQAGSDAFYYTPATGTQLIPYLSGATDTVSSAASGSVHSENATTATAGGYAIGTENQYNPTSSLPIPSGAIAWVYNPSTQVNTQLSFNGVTTAGDTFTAPASSSSPYAGNSTVTVKTVGGNYAIGGVTEFSSTTNLGTDAYLLNATGGNAVANIIDPAAVVNGVYYVNPGTSARNVTTTAVNPSGQVVGTASRYTAAGGSAGTDAFFYNGTATQIIGLDTGNYLSAAGVATDSVAANVSNNGITAGTATNYAAYSGTSDAWLSKGGSTVQVGLSGGVYQVPSTSAYAGYHTTSVAAVGSGGTVVGSSPRYDQAASFTQVGQDAWAVNGNNVNTAVSTSGLTNTVEVGLNADTGYNQAYYQYTANGNVTPTRYSAARFVNALGEVAGYSYRYNAAGTQVGQDAFVYNPATAIDYAINLSTSSDGVTAYSNVAYLSDTGVAVGYYTDYVGATAQPGYDAFAWELVNGTPTEFDLGSVTTNLSSAGWSQLYQAFAADGSGDIIGYGALASYTGTVATSTSLADQSVYELTAVPEPASAGVIAVSAMAVLGKRRRRRV